MLFVNYISIKPGPKKKKRVLQHYNAVKQCNRGMETGHSPIVQYQAAILNKLYLHSLLQCDYFTYLSI